MNRLQFITHLSLLLTFFYTASWRSVLKFNDFVINWVSFLSIRNSLISQQRFHFPLYQERAKIIIKQRICNTGVFCPVSFPPPFFLLWEEPYLPVLSLLLAVRKTQSAKSCVYSLWKRLRSLRTQVRTDHPVPMLTCPVLILDLPPTQPALLPPVAPSSDHSLPCLQVPQCCCPW